MNGPHQSKGIYFRGRVTVQPGGVIRFQHPDLPVGATCTVIILIETPEDSKQVPTDTMEG